MKIYRQVKCSDRLPTNFGLYDTDLGVIYFNNSDGGFWSNNNFPNYWYEKVELPSEEEVISTAKDEHRFNHDNIDEVSFRLGFEVGANFILNKLKNG